MGEGGRFSQLASRLATISSRAKSEVLSEMDLFYR